MIISPERERTLRRVLDMNEDTGDARRGTKGGTQYIPIHLLLW